MKKLVPAQIRQGDVFLQPVKKLPAGEAKEIREPGRVVLAHGEVTGHAHAIYDVIDGARPVANPGAADEMAEAAIARAQKAAKSNCRLVEIKGDRFLEVSALVNLKHEEHSPHALVPGLYEVPIQVEHTAERVRRVAD